MNSSVLNCHMTLEAVLAGRSQPAGTLTEGTPKAAYKIIGVFLQFLDLE